MRAIATFLVAAALGGCGSPAGPRDPGETAYLLHPTTAWAGSTITVRSEAFRGLDPLPNLRLGLAEYPMLRQDATTLRVQLTTAMGGLYDPAVMLPDTTVLLDQLMVWGFAGTRRYGPNGVWFPWDVYVWPEGGTSIIGATLGGGLTTINLATDEVETFGGLLDHTRLRGPGTTPQDSVFLLRAGTGPVSSWKVGEAPLKIGEHPEFAVTRQLLRLGPHSWLLTFNNRIETWVRSDSAEPYVTTAWSVQEPAGLHLSPRRDRATLRTHVVGGTIAGVPVFAAPGGTLAYYVALRSSTAVDWSRDGALLAIAGTAPGSSQGSHDQLLLLDATSGAVLGQVTGDRPIFGVAIDERRPFVYAGITDPTGRPAIRVYQRPTLALVAEMGIPASEATCGLLDDCYGGVVAVGGETAYAFYGWNGPTRSVRFFLPPP